MTFGVSLGRRHAKAAWPDPELADRPPQPSAQCANCEAWYISAKGELPKGWVVLDDPKAPNGQSALCAYCAPKPLRRKRAIAAVAQAGPSRYRGCRLAYEIALDHAAIQIRGGDDAPAGRDEAVSFLMDGPRIDALIARLTEIRGQLPAGSRADG